jgi:hypothetical protein
MSKFLHGQPKFSRGPSVGDRWWRGLEREGDYSPPWCSNQVCTGVVCLALTHISTEVGVFVIWVTANGNLKLEQVHELVQLTIFTLTHFKKANVPFSIDICNDFLQQSMLCCQSCHQLLPVANMNHGPSMLNSVVLLSVSFFLYAACLF